MDGGQASNVRVAERVSGGAGRVGPCPDTSGVVGDVVGENIVSNGGGLLLSPSGEYCVSDEIERGKRKRQLTRPEHRTNPHPFHEPLCSAGIGQYHHQSFGW